ncbi:hypothetical protein GEMRC1_004663 [Eukaryota sp. GEM-RC1]
MSQHIRLTDQSLTDVPSIPQSCETLYLFGNKLTSITLSLPLLTILHLQENQLSSIDVEQCKLLVKLYIDNNCISTLSLPPLVEELSLAYQSVPFDLFLLPTLSNLSILDVSFCHLTDLSPLSSFSALRSLTAKGNLIDRLSAVSALADLLLTVLDLSGNPLCATRHYREETVFFSSHCCL